MSQLANFLLGTQFWSWTVEIWSKPNSFPPALSVFYFCLFLSQHLFVSMVKNQTGVKNIQCCLYKAFHFFNYFFLVAFHHNIWTIQAHEAKMLKVSQSWRINSLEIILYLFRIFSNLYLPDGLRALECSHGAQAPLEPFFGIPGVGIFPLTLTRLLCAVLFKHFPLLLRQLFKRVPIPAESPEKRGGCMWLSGVSRCCGIIGFLSPWWRWDCSHHNGIISPSKNPILDLLTDLPGNPSSLSALLGTVLSAGGWMEGVNRAALKPFSII